MPTDRRNVIGSPEREAMFRDLFGRHATCKAEGPRRRVEVLTDDPDARVHCQRQQGHDGAHVHETGVFVYVWTDPAAARTLTYRDVRRALEAKQPARRRTPAAPPR